MRGRRQRAWESAEAQKLAYGSSPVDKSYADAWAMLPEEVGLIADDINNDRIEANALRKLEERDRCRARK